MILIEIDNKLTAIHLFFVNNIKVIKLEFLSQNYGEKTRKFLPHIDTAFSITTTVDCFTYCLFVRDETKTRSFFIATHLEMPFQIYEERKTDSLEDFLFIQGMLDLFQLDYLWTRRRTHNMSRQSLHLYFSYSTVHCLLRRIDQQNIWWMPGYASLKKTQNRHANI